MAAPAVQLSICLFFLGVLVLLRMEREKMRLEHPESFRNLAAGVGILSLVALIHLAESTGLLTMVPFMSEVTFRQLTVAIATITGVILLVSGMSLWLPLGRTLRLYNKLRIRHLDLLRRVEQLVGVESRLTVILEKTLGYMIEQFGFDGGAVFVRSRRSRHMPLLHSSAETEELAAMLPHTSVVQTDAASESGAPDLRMGLPDGVPQPSILLPVEIRGRVAAAFALWSGPESDSVDDDRVLLKLTSDTLARRLQAETHRIEREFAAFIRARRDALREIIARSVSFEAKLSAVAAAVAEAIPCDICSLTVTFDENDTRRFTLGRPGSLLTQKGLAREPITLDTVLDRPQVINDIGRNRDDVTVAMFVEAEMKSIMSLALTNGAGSLDRLVVASSSANAYSARDVEFVSAISDLVRALLLSEVTRRRAERTARRFELVNDFLGLCSGYHRDSASIFDQAACSLREETGAAVVRISTFENDAAFIRSRALAAAHPLDRAVPSDGHLIQALMPFHRRVRESRESLNIDGSRGLRMSRAEAQQIYQDDLRSALFVPITIAGEVRGVIALAERRRPTRFTFTEADQTLAVSMASALSLAIRLHETPWGVVEDVDDIEVAPSLLPSRLQAKPSAGAASRDRFEWESDGPEKTTVRE